AGPQGIGLDVAEHDQEVIILLDDRAFEAPLPDMADAAVLAMIAPGMRDGERLQNAADGLAGRRAEQKVKMVGHQAVAEQLERIAELRLAQGMEESAIIGRACEDGVAIIAAIDDRFVRFLPSASTIVPVFPTLSIQSSAFLCHILEASFLHRANTERL